MRLREAADTLRRLPSARVRARLSSWPDVVQDATYALYGDARGTRLAAPSPPAIDRMEQTLAWLLSCSAEERRILWARACGIPWRRLEDIDGRSHVTLRKVEHAGLSRIRRRLLEHPDHEPLGAESDPESGERFGERSAQRSGASPGVGRRLSG